MVKAGFLRRAAALVAAGLLVIPARAAPTGLTVTLDGAEWGGEVRLIEDVAYVPLRAFSAAVDGEALVNWDNGCRTASVVTESLSLEVSPDRPYLEANGRLLWCSSGVLLERGTLYVPLRALGSAFGYRCEYDAREHAANLVRERAAIEPGEDFYDTDAVFWLSRIIHAEAGGEPFDGKLAVGAVVLNRVDADEFPDTIWGVIFDTANGVQFTPTVNGAIWQEADADSVTAAKLCLEGLRISPDALYFLNSAIAESFWVPEHCAYVCTIGAHDFYA